MTAENLIHMANRIGQFFAAMPDRDEALREIAQHLRKFWAPSMRQALLSHLEQAGDAGLLDIVRDALHQHRASLQPGHA